MRKIEVGLSDDIYEDISKLAGEVGVTPDYAAAILVGLGVETGRARELIPQILRERGIDSAATKIKHILSAVDRRDLGSVLSIVHEHVRGLK